MNPKALISLFVILCVISIAYVWDTRRVDKKEELQRQRKQLVSLEHVGISEVVIQQASENIRLIKEEIRGDTAPVRWSVVEPVTAQADTVEVNALISTLTSATIDRRLPPGERDTLSAYGLDPPERSITLKNATGEEVCIDVGSKSLTESKAFLRRRDSEEVLVVPEYVRSNATKNLFDLRDKALFTLSPDSEERIDVDLPARGYSLEKRQGTWYVHTSVERRAATAKAASLLRTLRSQKAKDFIDTPAADLSSYGIVSGGTSITVLAAGGEQQRLRIGTHDARRGDAYAKRDDHPSILLISTDWIPHVDTSPASFYDDKLIATPSYAATELLVYDFAQNATTTLRKVDYAWELVEPATRTLDAGSTGAVYDRLTNATVFEFVDVLDATVTHGLSRPWLTLRVTTNDAKKPLEQATLYIDGPDIHRIYALRAGEELPTVFARREIDEFIDALRQLAATPAITPISTSQ